LSEDSGKSTVTFCLKHYDACGNNKRTVEAQTLSCRARRSRSLAKIRKGGGPTDLFLLKRFSINPEIEKARAEFERAQKTEEKFHKDFDGADFTSR
jgi:hypothetical protein